MIPMLAMKPSTRLILQSLTALDAVHTPVTLAQVAEHSGFAQRTVERALTDLRAERIRRMGDPPGYSLIRIETP